jgi:hypothetical protein
MLPACQAVDGPRNCCGGKQATLLVEPLFAPWKTLKIAMVTFRQTPSFSEV